MPIRTAPTGTGAPPAVTNNEDEKPQTPHVLRAALMMAGQLGVEEADYWYNIKVSLGDWDVNSGSLAQDFLTKTYKYSLDEISFDTNVESSNTIGHPIQGSTCHLIGRYNGLTLPQTLLACSIQDNVWEKYGELHEKEGLNDHIITIGSGTVLGEALYQLSTGWGHGGKYSLGVYGGQTIGDPRPRFVGLSLAGERSRTPDDAQGQKVTNAGHDVELRLSASMNDNGFDAGRVFGKSSLGGLEWRNLHGGQGWKAALRLSGDYDWEYERARVGPRPDHIGTVSFGPTAEVSYKSGDLRARATADLAGGFGLVTPLALSQPVDLSGTKQVLRDQGYDYSTDATGRISAEVGYRGLSLGGRFELDHWGSIEGLDRDQKHITDDFHIVDTRTRKAVEAGYTWGQLRAGVTLEARDRTSRLKDISEQSSELRLSAGLTVSR